MKEDQGVLVILAVTKLSAIGEGSLVEVELVHFRRDFEPENIEAKYDLASLGEVKSVRRLYDDPRNPPRWAVDYKGNVSAKRGD